LPEVKQEGICQVDKATELHELPSTAQNHLSMKKWMAQTHPWKNWQTKGLELKPLVDKFSG
jgi:hypothetical protein